MTVKYKKFSSGLRLISQQMKGISSFSLGVFVGIGSSMEKNSENGYAHFNEHLSFKGTTKRTSYDISREVDSMGGDINAYTGKDITCYYTRAANRHVEQCFDILSDMYFNSTFPDKELDSERKVVLEEISMDEDSPDNVCTILAARALFGDKNYGQTVTGLAENISSVTKESLVNFRKKHYTAKNTVLSIVGNFDYKAVCEYVERFFNQPFLQTGIIKYRNVVVKPQIQSEFLHRIKNVEQSHVAMNYPVITGKDVPYLKYLALANIFGGGMSSRLFQEVREKHGLAYSVYSFFSRYPDCGYFQVYFGTNPKNLLKASETVFEQINSIRKEGITQDELSLAKSQMLGSTQLSYESTMVLMRLYGGYLLRYGKVYDVNAKMKEYQDLSIDDINEAAEQVFSQPYASSYVGKEVPDFDKCKYR